MRNGGTLTVSPRFGSLTNEGTIIIECGGAMVYDATTFSGNPPQYLCPPTVTIDQATGQADPTLSNPLLFTVGFNRAVSGFTAADVTLSGTAAQTNATVSVSGGPIGYTVAVNGISGEGTTVNAGAGIPVKFSLGGNFGLNILASGYPVSQNVSCDSGGSGSSSPIEETVTAGSSGLQYDATTQTYTYLWKTDKAWGGTCRQLIVRLIDGTDHIALFQFNGNGRSAGESHTESGEAMVQRVFLPLVNQ